MLLAQEVITKQGTIKYNNISDKLRLELEKKIESFGKIARYKFNISHPNPDKTLHSGKKEVWPAIYTLKPTVFTIIDPYDKQRKNIALYNGLDNDGKLRFKKIKVNAVAEGNYALDLTDPDNQQIACVLELHPRLVDGQFKDKNKMQMIVRIDEKKLAGEKRTERSERVKALNKAQSMSEKEIVQFADAMLWDSADEPSILRDRIEEMAETTPSAFNKLFDGKSVEYRATIKKALDKQVIGFNPAEWKFIWSANQETLTVLQPIDGLNEVEQLAEFLMTGGEKGDKTYTTLKSLLK
jgi:hypothetical protein